MMVRPKWNVSPFRGVGLFRNSAARNRINNINAMRFECVRPVRPLRIVRGGTLAARALLGLSAKVKSPIAGR